MGEEEGVGERPDASGHGRDRRCDLARRGEVDVADEMAVDHVDADIDDDGTGLEHVAGHEAGMSGRNDDDVGQPGMGREVAGPRVADGDGGVLLASRNATGIPTTGERPITTASAPTIAIAGSFQDLERGVRRRRNEALEPEPEQPRVERMDAVDVLVRVDRVDHGTNADTRGQGHLHDDPGDLVVRTQSPYCGRDFPRLACRIVTGHVDQATLDSYRSAGLEDAVEVDHRWRGPAADHDRKAGRVALLASEDGDILGDAGADLVGDRGSLEEACPGLDGHAGIRQRGRMTRHLARVPGVRRRPRLRGSSRQGS